MKTPDDKVLPEFQKIKQEIDNSYKSNPLLKLPFATAAWHLLAFAEGCALNELLDMLVERRTGTRGTQGVRSPDGVPLPEGVHTPDSGLITEIRHSISWLYHACEKNGQILSPKDNDLYKASEDLFNLSGDYYQLIFAFTCAADGLLDLELQGSTLQPTRDFLVNIAYEAYDILIDAHQSEKEKSSRNTRDFPKDTILPAVKIAGDRFRCEFTQKMVSAMKAFLKPIFDKVFLLPSEWEFSRYTLKEFREVFETIAAIAHIYSAARLLAVHLGCENRGYIDSLYIRTYSKLIRNVARYSNISPVKVRNVLDDLTYTNSDIKSPLSAFQPLIKLNSKHYAIVPSIWLSFASEREITALLNRISDDQKVYNYLQKEKVDLLKARFKTELADGNFEFVSGKGPNPGDATLDDVDLAIINHAEKACLLLELKWLITPVTAHERINSSKDIKSGVSQSLKLKQAFVDGHEPLLKKLNIDSSYRLEGVVVSENWIGSRNVQSPEVPVIRANHLIAKLKTTDSLQATMQWLKDREYLPKYREHYSIFLTVTEIGDWTLKRCRIQDLNKGAFFPL